MCRHKQEGIDRCPSDTSEARRLRRKTQQSLGNHSPISSIEPAVPSMADAAQFVSLETFEDMKTESARLSELLKAPRDPDREKQREIDAVLEQRVTKLGFALAGEAEERARFDKEKYQRSYNRPSFGTLANMILETPDEETGRQRKMREKAAESLAEGYKSVIADIRPVGGEIGFHEGSNPEGMEMLQNSVGQHYPTEWLKESEKRGLLAVNVVPSDERASYADEEHYSDREDGEKRLKVSSFYVEAENTREYLSLLSEENDPIETEGDSFVEDEKGLLVNIVSFPERFPFLIDEDPSDSQGKPYGDGWKRGYVPNPDGTLPKDKEWYRHEKQEGSVIPTMYLNSKSDDPTSSASYHEFAHRAEAVVGNEALTRMEESFLRRRTTDRNGKREKLTTLYPGSEERVRRDNFMHAYVGKEYQRGRDREVMAMGAESLFSGGYGSFMGLDLKHKADLDHRAFTLGMFASA